MGLPRNTLVTLAIVSAAPVALAVRTAAAEDSLTNADVIKLCKLDLGNEVVIAKINQAKKTDFKLDTDSLINLKSKGVSKPVIAAMLKRNSPSNDATSTTAQPVPLSSSETSSAAPSEAEVKTCVASIEDLGRIYGDVIRIEYGTPMLSQGGIAEMRLGAPSGTRIYPIRLYFHNFRTGEAWMFRDPFGSLKGMRHGVIEHRPPTTKEEMVVAIESGETVTLPVKILMNNFGPPQFSAGNLSISLTSVGLRVPDPNLDFSVPTAQVYNVDTQNWQLHLHLLVFNARDRENTLRKDVYLWDPSVQVGRGGGVDCSSCSDKAQIIETLIRVACKK